MKRMKKLFLLLLAAVFLLHTGCASQSGETGKTEPTVVGGGGLASTPAVGGQACGYMAHDIDEALLTDRYGASTCVVVGTITGQIVCERLYGDVRRFKLQQVLRGDVDEVNLSQMYSEPRLQPGKSYLLIIELNDYLKGSSGYIENQYEVVGVGTQCAFWIEDGELCGNDPKLVAEIESDVQAQTYARDGQNPDVNTMEGLVAYFTARVEEADGN